MRIPPRARPGLAVITAFLLLIDAELIRRWYVYGFHLTWTMPEGGHEPILLSFFDWTVLTFFAFLHAGLIWFFLQLRAEEKSAGARLMHSLLGDKKVIRSEKDFQDFTFKSEFGKTVVFKGLGFLLILVSFDFVNFQPSRETLPYQLALAPVVFLLWLLGSMLFLRTSRVEIGGETLRFSRFFGWTSVPVQAISKVRSRWFGVDVTVQYSGRRNRLYFYPESGLGPSPPPVVQFLEEVCRKNHGTSELL